MTNSLDKLLKYMPRKYNKNPGNPGPSIVIPGTGNPTPTRVGASNLYQILAAFGFSLDNMFNSISDAQEETYIGFVPVNVNVNYYPTNEVTVTDNSGNIVVDVSLNVVTATQVVIGIPSTVIDLNNYFYFNATTSNLVLTLPDPTITSQERFILIKNTGTNQFNLYGLFVLPNQTIILNWVPSETIATTTIPGRWVISAQYYFYFNPSSPGTFQNIPNPVNTNINNSILGISSLIINTSNQSFFIGTQLINANESVLFSWNNTISVWEYTPTNLFSEILPIGADSLSGNFYIPGGNTWLDDVGESYGTLRIFSELDDQYRNRIRQLILGNKVSKPGIQTCITIVFGFTPKIYNWYRSDYTTMISSLITPSAFKYDPSTNQMVSYSLVGEPNYPNFGPPCNWYCVVNNASITNLTDAVYADFSFDDWYEGLGGVHSTPPPKGGFFTANPDDVGAINSNILILLGQFLHRIKAAGTTPILVVTD
jgi:hypothetical protein